MAGVDGGEGDDKDGEDFISTYLLYATQYAQHFVWSISFND